jgi:MoaA/NifB/PqqE/SkfB family radical SAM enzyme
MAVPPLLELELTGRCNLAFFCYNESPPKGSPGTMAAGDWENVITLAAVLGIRTVQFIGGEPTLSPDLPRLVRHALACGRDVIVFSNLVPVSERLWALFALPGVSLATSWYATGAAMHEAITGSKSAWGATRAGIARAVRLGIPLRVAIIDGWPGQDALAAEAAVRSLGATRVTVHRRQRLGRAAASDAGRGDPAELCGSCGAGRAAVLPDGTLAPCGMSRWLGCGNVRDSALADLLAGDAWRQALAAVPRQSAPCGPNCGPSGGDGENCAPDNECAPASNARVRLPLLPAGGTR